MGHIGVNVVSGQVQIIDFTECAESKLEIISTKIGPNWDQDIEKCLLADQT